MGFGPDPDLEHLALEIEVPTTHPRGHAAPTTLLTHTYNSHIHSHMLLTVNSVVTGTTRMTQGGEGPGSTCMVAAFTALEREATIDPKAFWESLLHIPLWSMVLIL